MKNYKKNLIYFFVGCFSFFCFADGRNFSFSIEPCFGIRNGVLDEFDRIIGLDKLKAVHLNDSKNVQGSHKDRHECIGKGCIGLEALVKVINNPRLQGKPFILETPNELDGYKEEIALLKSLYTGK